MKKALLLFLVGSALLIACTGYAEISTELDGMNVAELIKLRQEVDRRILQEASQTDHSDYSLDGFVYVSNGSEVHINYYEGNNPNVVIPAEIDGLPVTQIHERAFRDNKTIQSVIVSEGIVNLPNDFLCGCENLTSISLPEGITEIPSECFDGCKNLTELNLPQSVTKIGDWVLMNTGVKRIILREGIEEIARGAFQGANALEGIIILPTTLTKMGDYAFSVCHNITGFVVQSDIRIGESSFSGGKVELLYVKDGCNAVFEGAPFGAKLKTAILPASVTSIGDEVFASCNMLTIICPPGSYAESYAKSHFLMCDTEHYDQYIQEYDAMIGQ